MLFAAPDTKSPPVQTWTLSTGSEIAYRHFPAAPPARDVPVVFLHGGPGAFIVDHEAEEDAFFRSLAADHFDIYMYDQIGSGRSARLPDPRQYTVHRQVADLEAIRQAIAASKLILIGDSWGATLAANYMAENPLRCAKVIFTSPGAIDRNSPSGQTVREDSQPAREVASWTSDFENRHRRAMELLDTDPLAAHQLLPDSVADAEFDALLRRLLPTLVCDRTVGPVDSVRGMGWWVNTMTSRDLARRDQDTASKLHNNRTPALILRGACDYLQWDVAAAYRSILPNSVLLHVPRAGHWISHDQAEIFHSAIRNFLLDRPLPLGPYTSKDPPPQE